MPEEDRRSHIVITIHGIRTYGSWQKRIQRILRSDSRWRREEQQKEVLNYKYGVLTLLSFVIPFLRTLAVNQFRSYLESVFEGRTCARVDIVAHSFGTYLAIEALASPQLSANVRVHTAILCGSAVSPNRNVSRLVGPGRRIGRLVNDCGTRDAILLMTIPIYGVGMAGRLGLQGLEGSALHNRYHRLGHSGYFEHGDRSPYDGFMQRWWLPLLLSDGPVTDRDRRPRNPSLADRIWRFLGENGAKAALTLYIAVVAGLGWVVAESIDSRRTATERERQAMTAQSRFLAEQAHDMVRRHNYSDAIATALEGLPSNFVTPERPLVPQTIHALWTALLHYPMRAVLSGHRYSLSAAAYAPDGARVVTGGIDGVRLWNGESGQLVAVLEDKELDWRGLGTISNVAFSPDGKQVLAASRGGNAWLWRADDGQVLARLKGHSKAISTAVFSAEQDEILTGSDDGTARIWSGADGIERLKVELKGRDVRSAAYAPLGQSFVTASEISSTPGFRVVTKETVQGAAHVWNAEDGELIAEFVSQSGSCNFALFSPDGKILAVGEGSELALWDVADKQRLHVLRHNSSITTAAFSPDGELLLTVSQDGRARVWETESWQFRFQVEGDWGRFSPDGTKIVTVNPYEGAARIWSAESGEEFTVLKGHAPSSTMVVAFSGDGRRLVTASGDADARLWNSDGGSLFDKFNMFDRAGAPRVGATQVEFIDDGGKLVTTSHGRKHLWQVDSGRSIESVPNEFAFARIFVFSRDGARAVTADFAGTAELHNIAKDGAPAKFPGKGSNVPLYGAALSADGARLATWYSDGTIRVWNAANATRLFELAGTGKSVWNNRFLPSGELLTVFLDGSVRILKSDSGEEVVASKASYERLRGFDASADGRRVIAMADYPTVEIRSVGSGSAPIVISGGRHYLLSVALTSDGRRAAIGSQDTIARVVDTATGREIASMKGHASSVASLRFSRDGKTLFTGSDDGTVRIWDAESGAPRLSLPGHGVGLLTRVTSIAVTDDSTRLATLTADGTVRIWRLLPDAQALIDFARWVAPQCLTPSQRKEFNLRAEPPLWCITGPGRETERDPSKWEPRSPYQGQVWKEWLAAKRVGKNPPVPPI